VLLADKSLDLDVLCFTEHWQSEDEISYFNFEHYCLISKFCRKSKQHRGSFIYIKTNLKAKSCNVFENLKQEGHFEASIIELTQLNTVIMCVYRTPNSNINTFIETLDSIISNLKNKGKSIIIFGDLNIDFIGSHVNFRLLTMLNSYGFQAIVDVPTRIGSTSNTAIDQIILTSACGTTTSR
jgi:exonuclease III